MDYEGLFLVHIILKKSMNTLINKINVKNHMDKKSDLLPAKIVLSMSCRVC